MRREKDFVITDRGVSKTYHLKEMPAMQAYKWAARALLGLIKTNPDIPPDVVSTGMAGLASVALTALGGIDWATLEPLMDEMMSCVTVKFGPASEAVRPLAPDGQDFEDVQTIFAVQKELLELHLGFSLAAKLSTSSASVATGEIAPTTPTSLASSV